MTRQRYIGLTTELVRRIMGNSDKVGEFIRFATINAPKRVQEQGKSYKEMWESMADIRRLYGM